MYKHLFPILIFSTLLSCKQVQHISSTDYSYIRLDTTKVSEDKIEALIKPYRAELSEEMGEVIGKTPAKLVKSKPNSNLGNWFADVLLEEANKLFEKQVDVAVQNYGGLRVPYLAKGDISVGKIYELMPFDNTLVVMEMNGNEFQKFVDGIAIYGGWPISHSLSFKMTDRGAKEVLVNGKEIAASHTYRVAMPDYVANGGDKNDFLRQLPYEDCGIFIRDIVINHLKNVYPSGKAITVDQTKRISR